MTSPQPQYQSQQPAQRQGGSGPGRVFIILAFVFGGVSILFLPILFGPAAVVMAIIGNSKGDPLGRIAIPFAVIAMIVGFALGAIVFSATT